MIGLSFWGTLVYGLVYALLITLPILAIILVGRAIKRTDTPHQKEMRRLLGQGVEALEENNRLLNQQITVKRTDENEGKNRPAEATTPVTDQSQRVSKT